MGMPEGDNDCYVPPAPNDESAPRSSHCSTVFRFDAESYCLIFCREHSDVVQMTSNIADAEVAEMMADGIRKRGGHVFRAVPAGVLVAALELIKKPEQVVR